MSENQQNTRFVAASEAFYDDEKELWGTYIGKDEPGKPLFATIWGTTSSKSTFLALKYAELLNFYDIKVE